MTFKQRLQATAGALALLVFTGNVHSAPFQSVARDFHRAGAMGSQVEQIQYRLCVTEGGSRRCRAVEIYGRGPAGYAAPGVYGYQAMGPRTYGYQSSMNSVGTYPLLGYGYAPIYGYVENYTDAFTNPDVYPAGSRPWWQIMEKLGRGGHQD
jgi:hypothetical protein